MRRVLTRVLAVGAALLLGAAPAWAHSQLDGSNPANGASVATPPSSVSLTFNEDVQPGFTVITLIGPDGKDYHSGDVTETDQTVKVDALPLGPAGQYQIGYRVVSADGHPVSGKTTFTLTTAGPGSPDAKVPDASAAPNAVPSAAPPEPGARRCGRGSWGRSCSWPVASSWRCGWAACRERTRRLGRGAGGAASRPGGGMRSVDRPWRIAGLTVAERPTHRGGTPDSPWRNARLTVAERPTHRAETPDSPWRNARLTVAKRPTHRGETPDSPWRNARLTVAEPDAPW